MPWRMGLDEAGYGPNLGPFVQTIIAIRVPDGLGSIWEALEPVVRRADTRDDGRLLIDDSKKVHQGPRGLAKLERGVFACFSEASAPRTLGEFLENRLPPSLRQDLDAEPWFDESEPLPLRNDLADIRPFRERLHQQCAIHHIEHCEFRFHIVPTPRFNAILDEAQVKSAVVLRGLEEMGRFALALPGDESLAMAIDMLGGRHFYSPLLEAAFPGVWVHTLREGPEQCDYQLLGLKQEIRVRFQPRADGEFIEVALASMFSKYLREVFMMQFNRWWAARVPNLKPTAGYPVDAARFFNDIRATMETLGIPESAVWRRK